MNIDQKIEATKKKIESSNKSPNPNCTLCWGRGYIRRVVGVDREIEACGCLGKLV